MSRNIATKVTDMMADWAKKDADAQAEAVTRLGLPENNTAQDRAKAMGFDWIELSIMGQSLTLMSLTQKTHKSSLSTVIVEVLLT